LRSKSSQNRNPKRILFGGASSQMKAQGLSHNPIKFLKTLILFILLSKMNKISVFKNMHWRRQPPMSDGLLGYPTPRPSG
jgi:hypothetical protein